MTASRPLAAASFALLALLFTGCAAAGTETAADSKGEAKSDSAEAAPAADQSKEEACTVMLNSLKELESLSTIDQSDPAAAIEALRAAEAQFTGAAEQVSNSEVKPAADTATGALTDYVAYLDGMLSDPANADLTAMGDQITAFSEGIAGLSTVCA